MYALHYVKFRLPNNFVRLHVTEGVRLSGGSDLFESLESVVKAVAPANIARMSGVI